MKWIFWIAAALIWYAYLGYPLWLWFRSRWSPRPVRRGVVEPRVSAVMVVRNEEAVIAEKIENLLALDYPAEKLEIIVISDGSTDGTAAILQDFASNSRLRSVLKTSSQGKAAGLNDAMKLVKGEIVLFTDARQKIEPSALRHLMENFADAEVGCVSGQLMLGGPGNRRSRDREWVCTGASRKRFANWSPPRDRLWARPERSTARGRLFSSRCRRARILDDVLLPMQIVRKKSRVVFDSQARAWDSPDLGGGREFFAQGADAQRQLSTPAACALASDVEESDPI